MAYYPKLREIKSKSERTRVINNIIALKDSINDQMPRKTLERNLILGTWNIREFGKNNKAERLFETHFYIAEIISAFDLIAIQEIGESLDELNLLKSLLGSEWDFIITDITEGASGNQERLAFLFDTRKVQFRNMAGEIVLPDKPKTKVPTKQIARTPFIVAFQSKWFKFYITTVHIYYGKVGKKTAEYKRRIQEINDIAAFLNKRAQKEKSNHIILGDFNITGVGFDDPTMNALLDNEFNIPETVQILTNLTTNALRTMPYDQIAYLDQTGYIEFLSNENSAGILDFFQNVFREEDESIYKSELKKTKLRSYKEWKTYQMSDHLPMWVEFNVDFSMKYLNKLKLYEY
jgi:endonuclease/exonuclease/phosphatase family metal-dependent hydrolase